MKGRFLLLLAILLFPALPAQAGQESLRKALQKHAARMEEHKARVGILVKNLTTGEFVFSRNEDQAFSAASNTKLVTTAAALLLLGKDYHFQTRFRAEGAIFEGELQGDLWIQGGGDPCLSTRFFPEQPETIFVNLATSLKERGIHRIRGDLVLDDRFFDRQFVAPGWPRDQLALDYCAPVGALNFGEGCVELEVQPGPGSRPRIRISPAAIPFRLSNEIRMKEGKGNARVGFIIDAKGTLRARGSLHRRSGSFTGRVTVPDPAKYFGWILENTLENRGIRVDGKVRRVQDGENLPEERPTLYLHRSPLWNSIYAANKDSSNLHSEHLLKTLGRERGKAGSWDEGIRVTLSQLSRRGLNARGIELADGSGLSRGNRLTPSFLVDLLSLMYRQEASEMYLKSLPRSGIDGTLKKRMRESSYRGRVRAKTGWIRGASSLSGYARSMGDHVFVFSILVAYEGKTPNRIFKGIMDDICRELMDFDPSSQ